MEPKLLSEYTEKELIDELRRRVDIRIAARREKSVNDKRCRYCTHCVMVKKTKYWDNQHYNSGFICDCCSYTTKSGIVKPYIVTPSTKCKDPEKFNLIEDGRTALSRRKE